MDVHTDKSVTSHPSHNSREKSVLQSLMQEPRLSLTSLSARVMCVGPESFLAVDISMQAAMPSLITLWSHFQLGFPNCEDWKLSLKMTVLILIPLSGGLVFLLFPVMSGFVTVMCTLIVTVMRSASFDLKSARWLCPFLQLGPCPSDLYFYHLRVRRLQIKLHGDEGIVLNSRFKVWPSVLLISLDSDSGS